MTTSASRTAGFIAIVIGVLLAANGCKQSDPVPTAVPVPAAVDAYSSFVSKSGEMAFPTDFPNSYVFIGSWAVNGTTGVSEIHSVYARPIDVSNFKETGKFLDGAVLLKEVNSALGASHTTGNSSWAHETKTWFLMIKDSKQRFPSNPLWGDGWGWAEFDPATKKQISTSYKADCLGCHVPAKQSDWVYSYAYPALGPKGQTNIPKDTAAADRAADMPVHTSVSVPKEAGSDGVTGKRAFDVNCAACHSLTPGVTGIGPSLAGVLGRKAGTSPGYEYSPAMLSSEVIWTVENISKHIEKPKELIPGNRMGGLFPRGVQDAKQREDIVAYLQTAK